MGKIPRGRGSAVKSKVRVSLGRGRLGVGLGERPPSSRQGGAELVEQEEAGRRRGSPSEP